MSTLAEENGQGYPYDGGIDKNPYPHNDCSGKKFQPTDGYADKNPYPHEGK